MKWEYSMRHMFEEQQRRYDQMVDLHRRHIRPAILPMDMARESRRKLNEDSLNRIVGI